MAKYLIDSTDIEIEEVSGTENLKFNLASGNSTEQMIGDLSNLTTTNKSNAVNAINEINNLTIYSTTETSVGKWIDNKTIYRKVFSGTTNSSGNETTITLSNLDKLIKASGCLLTSGYINPVGLYTGTDNYITLYYNTTSNNLTLNYTDNYRNKDYYLIVEYTKN